MNSRKNIVNFDYILYDVDITYKRYPTITNGLELDSNKKNLNQFINKLTDTKFIDQFDTEYLKTYESLLEDKVIDEDQYNNSNYFLTLLFL